MNHNDDYRLLTESDIKQSADILSKAFINDPLSSYMFPNMGIRLNSLKKYFRVYSKTAASIKRGFGVGEPLQGIAFWRIPDVTNDPDVSFTVLLPLLFSFFPIGYLRASKVIKDQEELEKKHTVEPYFLLKNIGVIPSSQGKGLSSKLIRPFLQMAESQGVMAYTDTFNYLNVPIFEHFGFKCVEEHNIHGTNLKIWAFIKPAR